MVHTFGDSALQLPSRKDVFTFTLFAGPSVKFSFGSILPNCLPINRPFKRRRALSDVDGDGNEGRKKRRLRLHLITSRLSRPFSQPATNIVNHGITRAPVLGAKNKAPGRSEMRKAAIMNRVRLRIDEAKNFIRLQHEKGRATPAFREIILQKPRIHELPLPPSPLGLSNYDVLDLEDEMNDRFEDEEMDGKSAIYSDFNIMNPMTANDGEDYEYLDAIDGISPQNLSDAPPEPLPEDGIVGLLREKERQGDGSFAQVRK